MNLLRKVTCTNFIYLALLLFSNLTIDVSHAQQISGFDLSSAKKRAELRQNFQSGNKQFEQDLNNSKRLGSLVLGLFDADDDPEILADFGEWYMNSKWWTKTQRRDQAEIVISIGEKYFELDKIRTGTRFFEYALINYSPELKLTPNRHAYVLLELAFNYDYYGKKYLTIDNTKKALAICEANLNVIEMKSYLTAFNNLLFFDPSPENFERFVKAKQHHFDSVKAPTFDKLRPELILRKYDIQSAFGRTDISNILAKADSFYVFCLNQKQNQYDTWNYFLSTFQEISGYLNFHDTDSARIVEVANRYFSLAEKHMPSYLSNATTNLSVSLEKVGDFRRSMNILQGLLDRGAINTNSTVYFMIRAKIASHLLGLGHFNQVEQLMDQTMHGFVDLYFENETPLDSLHTLDYDTYNGSLFINLFATSALNYVQLYMQKADPKLLSKAESIAIAAAKMFENNYLKGEFNLDLDRFHKKIAETLLFLCVERYSNDHEKKKYFLELIEKNASQHLFKHFQTQFLKHSPELNNLFIEKNILEYSIEQLESDLLLEENAFKSEELVKNNAQLATVDSIIKTKLNGFTDLHSDISLTKTAALLKKNEVLLKYYVADLNVYKVDISQDDIRVCRAGLKEELKQLVSEYHSLMSTPSSQYREMSKRLFTSLIQDLPEKQKLIVIPDDFLFYLSFGSLIAPNNEFLIQSHELSYAQSLPIWYGLGVYPFKSLIRKVLCLTADYSRTPEIIALPGAEIEAQGILEICQGVHLPAAHKKHMTEFAKEYSIYHLAMHAGLSDEKHDDAHILFSDGERLSIEEIYTLDLPLDLVVLSACNTGNGAIKSGEGVQSLSRALTYAGVRSTVVSLWEVPDRETSVIMEGFYKNIKKGMHKDEALTMAKRAFLEDNPLKTHPFYWAGFTINGDTSALFEPRQYYQWIVIGILGLVLIILVIYFSFLRRSAA